MRQDTAKKASSILQDPVQDKFPEESMHGALRRNRIGSHSAARPASRSSNAGARNRGHQASPAYDQFNSNSPSQVGMKAVDPQ